MQKRKDPATYDVGYCKPPKATQFQKGQSGNPNGRRKEAPSGKSLLMKLLGTRIAVKEGGKTKHLLPMEILFRQILNKALQGDPKAALLLLRLAEQHQVLEPDLVEGRDYGVLVVPAPVTAEEWDALYGPGGPRALPVPGEELAKPPKD